MAPMAMTQAYWLGTWLVVEPYPSETWWSESQLEVVVFCAMLLGSISGWWCNNHLEKYESQWEGLSQYMENKNMFQTTNQAVLMLVYYVNRKHL